MSEHDHPAPPPTPDQPAEPEERRYPSAIGGAFYLLILLTMGAGLVVCLSGDWRLGVRVVSGALAAAAALRLVLPQKDAGMLAVRSRWVDVLLLAAVSVGLFVLAANIPDQPTP